MSSGKAYIAGLACAALFGLGTALTKEAVSGVHPLTMTFVVYLSAGATLATLSAWSRGRRGRTREERPPAPGVDLKVLFLGVVLGVVVAPDLFFYGLRHTTALNASFLLNTEVLVTVTLAYLLLKERAAPKDYAAIVLLLAAVVLVTTNLRLSTLSMRGHLFGNALVVAGCIFWGIDNNLSKILAVRHDLMQAVYLKSLFGGSLVLLFAVVMGAGMSLTMKALSILILVGVLAYGIGIYCFFYSLRHIGAMRSISLFSTQALFGALFAFVLLGEGWSPYHVAAGAMMFAGVWLLWGPGLERPA